MGLLHYSGDHCVTMLSNSEDIKIKKMQNGYTQWGKTFPEPPPTSRLSLSDSVAYEAPDR